MGGENVQLVEISQTVSSDVNVIPGINGKPTGGVFARGLLRNFKRVCLSYTYLQSKYDIKQKKHIKMTTCGHLELFRILSHQQSMPNLHLELQDVDTKSECLGCQEHS